MWRVEAGRFVFKYFDRHSRAVEFPLPAVLGKNGLGRSGVLV